jgi:YHS domain-containing protein
MYRLLLIIGLLILLYFFVRKALREFSKSGNSETGLGWRQQMIQDPVCRNYVARGQAIAAHVGGQTYYFCSTECAQNFQKQLSG